MTIFKDPQATLDYQIDWTDYLTPLADTLASVTFSASTGTLVDTSVSGMVATAWVSGGEVGETITLTCHIETVAGRVDERSIFIKIKDNLGLDTCEAVAASATVEIHPFDLTAFYPGIPPASVVITRVPLARQVIFPCPLVGSVAVASVAATAQTDFEIRRNDVFYGTIRFAPGATTATFPEAVACVGMTFEVGDVLSIVAPATPDATLADIGIVLTGTRQTVTI